MIIVQAVLDSIHRTIEDTPPETGGILGSKKADVVTHIVFDKSSKSFCRGCSYSPNVSFFNQCIAEWQDNLIQFMGIFHTHFANVKTLSSADIKYITEIMMSMPESITTLYFPVYILPARELVCYKAVRQNSSVQINEDELIVLASCENNPDG